MASKFNSDENFVPYCREMRHRVLKMTAFASQIPPHFLSIGVNFLNVTGSGFVPIYIFGNMNMASNTNTIRRKSVRNGTKLALFRIRQHFTDKLHLLFTATEINDHKLK